MDVRSLDVILVVAPEKNTISEINRIKGGISNKRPYYDKVKFFFEIECSYFLSNAY